jgi:hypothetical protein
VSRDYISFRYRAVHVIVDEKKRISSLLAPVRNVVLGQDVGGDRWRHGREPVKRLPLDS